MSDPAAPSKPGLGVPRLDAAGIRPTKERRKRKFPYRKAAEIEAEIAQRETRIQELHRLFAAEEIVRDGAKIKQLHAELAEHESALPRLYEYWEEATELNG